MPLAMPWILRCAQYDRGRKMGRPILAILLVAIATCARGEEASPLRVDVAYASSHVFRGVERAGDSAQAAVGSRRSCRGSRWSRATSGRADEQREVLGHEAGLDGVDADLLQRQRRTSSARRCRRAWRGGRGRASRRRSRRSSWSRSPCPSGARGSGGSPCRARLRLRRSCRPASSAPRSSGRASRSPAPRCRTARRRRSSCRPRHSRPTTSARGDHVVDQAVLVGDAGGLELSANSASKTSWKMSLKRPS
jgi:hypothetical protein